MRRLHLRLRLRRLEGRVRAWLAWIWARLLREPGYAEALAALIVTAVQLFCRSAHLRAVIGEIAHAVVVIVRTVLGNGEDPDEWPTWA